MLNPGSFISSDGFWALEKLGQVRLSKHFYLRQFLYSEIAAHFAVPNIPFDTELAIENGKRLCTDILEPITSHWGPIVIRSGYRSPVVNALGSARGLKCASNAKNAGLHIWDMRDEDGLSGACACVVVPSMLDEARGAEQWLKMADWLRGNVPFHKATFFQKDFAFNVGWHEKPMGEVWSYLPPREKLGAKTKKMNSFDTFSLSKCEINK